jgi:hypothetical protein
MTKVASKVKIRSADAGIIFEIRYTLMLQIFSFGRAVATLPVCIHLME